MESIRQMVQPLYDQGDLLGFSICSDAGEMLHNESYFSDEVARKATEPFVRVARQMDKASRDVNRLTVELDEVVLIYRQFEQGHALFTLERDGALDRAADVLS